MDPLGKQIGGDDHGSGIGLSGAAAQPTAQNSQAAMMSQNEKTGFNAGVGGEHASGGLPGAGEHPIADRFMSGSDGTTGAGAGAGAGFGSGKLDNSLDNFGGAAGAAGLGAGAGAGAVGAGAFGQGSDNAVSGAYEGGQARDALTGQSQATQTGQGVGYGGENLDSGAGAAGTGHAYGTGVGASGGAGGHYDPDTAGSGRAAGLAGAGAAGAGAGAAGAAGAGGNAQGHYGTTETDFDRGAPVSDPKELDSGGPHSLVFDDATGKYIHRHEKEGGALADEVTRAE